MTKQSLTKSDIKKVCDILRRDDGVGANSYIDQLSWLLFLKVFEKVEEELKELNEAEGKKYHDVIDKEYKWSSWATKDWKDKDELIYFVNQKLFPCLRGLKGIPQKEKVGEIFRELDGNKIRSPHTLLDVIDILDEIEMKDFQDTHLLSQVYEEILQELGAEGGWAGEFYTPRPVIRLMTKIVNPKIGETILDPFTGSGGFLVESFKHIQNQNKKLDVNSWKILQEKTFFGQEKKPIPYLVGTMNLILHGILVPNLIRTNTLMEDVLSISEKDKVDVILTNPPFGGKEHSSVQENYPIKLSATEGLALQYIMRRLKNGGRCGVVLPESQILFGGGAHKKIREELLEKFNIKAIISLPKGVFTQMGTGVKTNLIFFEKTGKTKKIWYGEVEGKFTKTKVIQDDHIREVLEKYQRKEISNNTWYTSVDEIKKRDFDLLPKNPNKIDKEELLEPENIIKLINEDQKKANKILDDVKSITVTAKKEKCEFVQLEEVIDYEQPTKYLVKSTNYDDSYDIPVLTAGKTFILGYINEKDNIFPEDKLPVIIFDDFTTAIKFVEFPFKVKSSAMKILHVNSKKADIKFLFYVMQNLDFCVRKHKRHWISEYSKIKIPLPSITEQKKISEKIDKIQDKTKLFKQILEMELNKLNKLNRSVLQKIFTEK